MRDEILTDQQKNLLPLLSQFGENFYLVGGTALALQLGHRRSIDFDLFSEVFFDSRQLRTIIAKKFTIQRTLIETVSEFTLIIDNIKWTFYHYVHPIDHKENFNKLITLPNPLTIAAMKAFALGRRAKWKDYVDLYFVMKTYSLSDVIKEAIKIFGIGNFDEKLFREQLAYHKDINYAEPIIYMPGMAISDEKVKQSLIDISLS